MNISWKWLLEYAAYDGPRDEAVRLLTMSGLNVDSVEELPGGDALLDVEVTSNRPDCLGHLGVARELAALTGCPLAVPPVDYDETDQAVADLTSVQVDDAVGCPRYTARVILGAKIGPSPRWLAERLEAVGLRPVNNVVDVTNFVLLEHGQPLHAFDLRLLGEERIVVRRARRGETFLAIDHSQHHLSERDLVIADASVPVALAGVMGGAESEVSDATADVLLEAAQFDPLSIRTTSRAQQLMSDASYHFERGVDYDGVDWASRRACRLILEVAGGRAARGLVDAAVPPPALPTITLRYAQVPRVLGIDVPRREVLRILRALGLEVTAESADSVTLVPPRFRRDLAREVDLIEEVARIHGFDKVPYLAHIPTVAPAADRAETVIRIVQDTLVAAGFHETVTLTLTDAESAGLFAGGDASPPLVTRDTAAAGAGAIRKNVLPGLLEVKRTNHDAGTPEVALFEIARGFRDAGPEAIPHESLRLALLADAEPEVGKGALEVVAERLGLDGELRLEPAERIDELDADGQADVLLKGRSIGFCGTLGPVVAERMKLRSRPWVAEVELQPLVDAAVLVPRYVPAPHLPAIERDLALVVGEDVLWRDVEACVLGTGVEPLEAVRYASLYRGKGVPEGSKCIALRLRFRRSDATLTHEQADAFQATILAELTKRLGAALRSQ